MELTNLLGKTIPMSFGAKYNPSPGAKEHL